MRAIAIVAAALLAGAILLSAGSRSTPVRSPFPHQTHASLFTSCLPCHADPATGRLAGVVSVTPADCARCHDGTTQPAVNWSPRTPRPRNLHFNHVVHIAQSNVDCNTCHRAAGATGRMPDVVRPGVESCLPCHAASGHFEADVNCSVCHRPLAEATEVARAEVAAYPHPPDHDDPDFIRTHGLLAGTGLPRCAICHTKETCETCHLNGADLAPVRELAADERARLQAERITPRWPKPDDHDAAWVRTHGVAANLSVAGCASCHVQSGCTECHGEGAVAGGPISRLPVARAGGPSGIGASGRGPVHDPGFRFDHGAAAASGSMNCAACHGKGGDTFADNAFCASCHGDRAATGFHGPAYINRHAADAYARDVDCASCHSSEVFCRSCHEEAGLAGFDSRSGSYHDAQPFWLLSHGVAARQGMESCASCHAQTDCLQCHSAKTGWRINPHGSGFDPERLADRSLLMCSRCHFSNPVPRSAGESRVPR